MSPLPPTMVWTLRVWESMLSRPCECLLKVLCERMNVSPPLHVMNLWPPMDRSSEVTLPIIQETLCDGILTWNPVM